MTYMEEQKLRNEMWSYINPESITFKSLGREKIVLNKLIIFINDINNWLEDNELYEVHERNPITGKELKDRFKKWRESLNNYEYIIKIYNELFDPELPIYPLRVAL